jgi:uncharacterized membrane protein YcaP (DUF421 family)
MDGYLIIALKSIAVYVFIVAAIRVFGKKEFAQLSVIDVVFILLIKMPWWVQILLCPGAW